MRTEPISISPIKTTKRRLRIPVSTIELILVAALVAVLGVSTYLVLNPSARINTAEDTRRKDEVEKIHTGITLFQIDKGGEFPTLADDTELPTVSSQEILDKGLPADQLVGMDGYFNGKIPTDPTSQSYRVAVSSEGDLLVGIKLSSGEIYIAKGINAPKPKIDLDE